MDESVRSVACPSRTKSAKINVKDPVNPFEDESRQLLHDSGKEISNFEIECDLEDEFLLDRNTYKTGTIPADRQNNPQDVILHKLKMGESIAEYPQTFAYCEIQRIYVWNRQAGPNTIILSPQKENMEMV
ncbi:hypothetical protein JTB14_013220 [Gonioctena quinquepunctata]|nr:hypothetical protein JTB14_013220 [Gonioctena quinquepunctata]